jgi:hypothetical protein
MDNETQAKVWAAAHGFECWTPSEGEAGPPPVEGVGGLTMAIDRDDPTTWFFPGQWYYPDEVSDDRNDWRRVPDLLTWAGMGALLDAMRAKWYFAKLDFNNRTLDHRCQFGRMDPVQRTLHGPWDATAPTLPLAVARAAAAALGVEGGG